MELRRRDIDLTECRLLDLFLWGYSGTYTPLYLRAESGAPMDAPAHRTSPAAAVAPSVPDPDSAPWLGIEIFQDDDAGYLAWLAAHPAGFALNMARTPARTT